jgi:hypothetical protein
MPQVPEAVLVEELALARRELAEALERQAATDEVLRVISSSPGELQPVFEAILKNATSICAAEFGVLHLHENGAFRRPAMYNVPPAFAQALAQREPLYRPPPLSPFERVATTKRFVHISDLSVEPAYRERDPGIVRMVELGGVRTLLMVRRPI